MISVSRDGCKVILNVEVPNTGTVNFPLSFDCSREWIAILLCHAMNEALNERISTIRREEYYAGIKDARLKKNNRREWFLHDLSIGVKK